MYPDNDCLTVADNGSPVMRPPVTPLCTTPMAKETWVEVGPGRHWDRPSSSRKTADDSHLSFSTKTCQEGQKGGNQQTHQSMKVWWECGMRMLCKL